MSQINANKLGKVINLSINGKLRKKVCNSTEEANELFSHILTVKADPSEEGIKLLNALLNEKTRIAMECGLETDPDNGEVYLAGFNTPVPITLVEVIKDYHENGYPLDAIVNFWKLLMINPDKRIRESLFDFIKTHDFVLTDNGYMVVYKAVYRKEETNNPLYEFLVLKHHTIKNKWKKSPKNFIVYLDQDDQEYKLTETSTIDQWNIESRNMEIIGNLEDLYNNISLGTESDNVQHYTDMHTQSMDIVLGEPVKMERSECDNDPANECSYGLHCGSTSYVQSFGNQSSAILVCYVNPANVIAVPDYDRSKMRVSEYFPFALAEYNDGKIDNIEQSFYESDYMDIEVEELEMMIENVQKGEAPIDLERSNEQLEETRPMSELQKIIENRIVTLNDING